MLKLVSILLISLTLSCGKKVVVQNAQPEITLKSSSFKTVGNNNVKVENNKLTGNGIVISATPLKGIDSNHNYQLQFKLKNQGSLRLISHTQQPVQENGRYSTLKGGGLNITFIRAEEQLRMNVGGTEIDPDFLKSIKTNEIMNISLDVHNDDDHPTESHIVLIIPGKAPKHFHGPKPQGNYWGLELNDAEVLEAVATDAKIDG